VLGIVRVRIPERHLRDVVALAHDLLGEAERLECLDGTGLDAIGLTDDEAGIALLDHPSPHPGILRELGGRDHSGRSAADDEDVDLIGQVLVAIDAVPGGLLDPRVSGHIAVLMEMHVNLRFVTRRRDAQILTVHIRSGAFVVAPVTDAAAADRLPMSGLTACSSSWSGPSGIPVRSRRTRVATRARTTMIARYTATEAVVPVAETSPFAMVGAKAPPRIEPMA